MKGLELSRTVGFASLFAWMLLYPQQAILFSSSLYGQALVACIAITGSLLFWFLVFRSRMLRSSWLGGALAGALSCLCGILFACATSEVVCLAAFAGSVLFAIPLFFDIVRQLKGIQAASMMVLIGCALFASAGIQVLVRLLTVFLGAATNMGTYFTVEIVVLSCLPAIAGVLFSRTARARVEPASPCEEPCRASVVSDRPVPRTIIVVLCALVAVIACIVFFFTGIVTAPFLFNTIFIADMQAVGTLVLGVLAYLCARIGRLNFISLIIGGGIVSFLAALGGLLFMVFAPWELLTGALLMLSWSCVGLVCVGWMIVYMPWPGGEPRVSGSVAIMLLLEGVFVFQLLGVVFKKLVGLDTDVVILTVLVAISLLLVAFFFASIVSSVLSSREMRASAKEGEEEPGQPQPPADGSAVTPQQALETVWQAYEEALADFDLTKREMEAAVLISRGKTMEEIADEMSVSLNTVRYHAKNIYRKVGVANRRELRQKVDIHLSDSQGA